MSNDQADTSSNFEVISELIALWGWGFRNLGVLVRLSWPSIILMIFVSTLLTGLILVALTGTLIYDPPEKGGADVETLLFDIFTSPLLYVALGGYLAFLAAVMFISAVPVGGATKLALDNSFRKEVGLGYFRFGSQEFRIGLLAIVIFIIFYGAQIVPQIWLLDDMFGTLGEDIFSDEPLDPAAMQEFMRLQSLSNGLYLLGLLVSAYFIGRILPAVPIIVSGGRGLGILQAWSMTRGKGFILMGTIIGAYIGLTVGIILLLMVLMIAAALAFAVGAAMIGTPDDTVSLFLTIAAAVFFVGLIFAYFGFQVGYFQRLQARVYEWLSAPAES